MDDFIKKVNKKDFLTKVDILKGFYILVKETYSEFSKHSREVFLQKDLLEKGLQIVYDLLYEAICKQHEGILAKQDIEDALDQYNMDSNLIMTNYILKNNNKES